MYLNASTKPLKCFVRNEFLHDLDLEFTGFVPAIMIGVSSRPGLALGFHIILDCGAVFWHVPIHALCWKEDAPLEKVDVLQLWNCFSYSIAVTCFSYLADLRVAYLRKDRKWSNGNYICTFDWCGDSHRDLDLSLAEIPDEHKCAHFIRLDSGNFALQPNNRIRWFESSFVVKDFPMKPTFKVNTHLWNCELSDQWRSEDSDKYMYQMEEIKDVEEVKPISGAI